MRYERAHPGALLHFNIKKLARRGGDARDKRSPENGRAIVRPGHRVTGDRQHNHTRGAGWEFLHTAIDDHCCSGSYYMQGAPRAKKGRARAGRSGLAFAQLFPDETAASALAFLHAALAYFHKHGVPIQRVYSDKRLLLPRTRHARGHRRPRSQTLLHPPPRPQKTKAKAERFIQTSLRESAYAHAYSHSDQRSQRLPVFLHNYNWHRPHHSLKLPLSHLQTPPPFS